jgi:hypothetical protein
MALNYKKLCSFHKELIALLYFINLISATYEKKSSFPVLYPNAAGIDIASREHYVAANPYVDQHPIRSFGTFT